jgi:hypothetical protein
VNGGSARHDARPHARFSKQLVRRLPPPGGYIYHTTYSETGVLMALRDVRVKTAVLTDAAQEMQRAANALPAAPKSVSPSGADPLATAITAHITSTVPPLLADRPAAIQEASGYAKNVGCAARAYAGTDEHEGDDIKRSMPARPASG